MDNCPILLPPPRPWRSPSCKGCGQLIDLERRRRWPAGPDVWPLGVHGVGREGGQPPP